MDELSREVGQAVGSRAHRTTRAVARGRITLISRLLIAPLAGAVLSLSPLLAAQAGWADPTEQIAQRTEAALEFGTAFAIRPEGLFMTNFHVVEQAKAIELSCPGIGSVPAAVETFSSEHDLAVLRVDGGRRDAYLTFAEPKAIRLGAEVFTVGYPAPTFLRGQPTYSEGTISGLSGPRGDVWLQISVPVLPGSSGSPVVNQKGEVVGVVVAMDRRHFFGTTGAPPQNIAWAIRGQYATALFERPRPEATGGAGPTWFVGTWEGEHVGPAIRTDVSRFEFTEERGRRRWTMSRYTIVRNWAGNLRASGVVRAITDSSVELDGTYDAFSRAHTAGASLHYRLSRRGDTLEGPVVGHENSSFRVSLRRVGARGREPAELGRTAVIRRVMGATCLVIVERQEPHTN
ncbi:MAG: serine protease [Candidatus Methylomirabilia bacterium]